MTHRMRVIGFFSFSLFVDRGQKHHRRIADDLLSDGCDLFRREEGFVRSEGGRDGFGQGRVHPADECAAAGRDLV